MNIFKTPQPMWEGEGAAASAADPNAVKPDPAAEAAAAAAADGTDKPADPGASDKGGGSFLDNADKPAPDKDALKPTDWPEDWRARMAGEDKDAGKLLDRYKSPADVAKALREANKKIGSGKTVSDEPMPDAEKEPEKAAEWRKARGIPDDPTGYAIPEAVKGLVTDADKPRLAGFTEAMHKAGIPTSAAGAAMEWYFQEQASANEAIAAADKADADDVADHLREEWGPDFRANSTIAKRFAEEAIPGVNWFSARLPDGRVLGNVPEIVKAFADMGRERFGDVTLAGAENSSRTMARKQELEIMMRDDPDKYFGDRKNAEEYTKIMDAEMRRSGGGGSNHSPKP